LLDSIAVMLVTCESNPAEIDALFARGERRADVTREDWEALRRLRPGQAIALPITDESDGRLRRFTVARRLTPHVRHRQKYVDVPVSEPRAFVFTPPNGRATTLRQFVHELEHQSTRLLEPFVERGDFSRWIRDVFGDHALAAELRAIEAQHRGRAGPDTVPAMIDAISARYDLSEDVLVGS
jgi:hypothetical protein